MMKLEKAEEAQLSLSPLLLALIKNEFTSFFLFLFLLFNYFTLSSLKIYPTYQYHTDPHY